MNSLQSPETQSKIANWRLKAQLGTITLEEMREAIKLMREDRVSSTAASPKAKSARAKAPKKSVDDLLGELENL